MLQDPAMKGILGSTAISPGKLCEVLTFLIELIFE